MNKWFTVYGTAVLLLFSAAAYRGDAVASIWAKTHRQSAPGVHYYYHK